MKNVNHPYITFTCGGFLGFMFLGKFQSIVMILLYNHTTFKFSTLYGINFIFKLLIAFQVIGYLYGLILIVNKKN